MSSAYGMKRVIILVAHLSVILTLALATGVFAQGVPAITGLSPNLGPLAGGTSVIITGTDFTGLSGASAVTFGGVNATTYTVDSATQITATAPAHAAGTVQVQVTGRGRHERRHRRRRLHLRGCAHHHRP